jgi:hypothetical protein
MELPWILSGMVIVLFLVSFVVRRAGWTQPAANVAIPAPLHELNVFGLILPLIIGLAYMVSAIMWMGGASG